MTGRDEFNLQAAFDFTTEALKGLQLLNGGGAIGLLTFYGNFLSKADSKPLGAATCHVELGLILFAIGALSAVISFIFAYLCQLHWGAVFKKNGGSDGPDEHKAILFQYIGMAFCISSAILFCVGIWQSAVGLSLIK